MQQAVNLYYKSSNLFWGAIQQYVVPKAGDSAWNGDYVSSSLTVLTISYIGRLVWLWHSVWGGEKRQFKSDPVYHFLQDRETYLLQRYVIYGGE